MSLSHSNSPGVHVGLVPLDGPVERDAHVVGRRGRAKERGDGLLEGVGVDGGAWCVGLGLEVLGERGDRAGRDGRAHQAGCLTSWRRVDEPDVARVGPLGALVEEELGQELVRAEARGDGPGAGRGGASVGEDAGRGLDPPGDEAEARCRVGCRGRTERWSEGCIRDDVRE